METVLKIVGFIMPFVLAIYGAWLTRLLSKFQEKDKNLAKLRTILILNDQLHYNALIELVKTNKELCSYLKLEHCTRELDELSEELNPAKREFVDFINKFIGDKIGK